TRWMAPITRSGPSGLAKRRAVRRYPAPVKDGRRERTRARPKYGELYRATLAQVLEVRRLVEGAAELLVRRPLAHRDPDRRTRMTWASASPPGRMPSSESPRAPAAHAAAARYAADASKRWKMRPPPAGPRTRAPADRDCETPSASPYTDSSTVFEIRLESEGLARPCPPTTSASAVSSPIADPAKGIPRKPRPSAALPRTISARSGRR